VSAAASRPSRGLLEGIEVVSLDAGGVLVVPRHDVLAAALVAAGLPVDVERFWAAHHHAMRAVDLARAAPESPLAFAEYLDGFLAAIEVPVHHRSEARRHLDEVFGPPLWCHPLPGALDGVRSLAGAGLRLVVTSNADGTVARQLRRAGVVQVGEGPGVPVEAVVDSGAVGVAKPDPAIFELTARTMGVPVTRVLHVGDSVHYDVEAATAAGMVGVHLDPHRLCTDRTHPHVQTLGDLVS
jgi:putative hydrolase of the HAD superfamily